jgi:hypothetical protein
MSPSDLNCVRVQLAAAIADKQISAHLGHANKVERQRRRGLRFDEIGNIWF